MLVRLWNYYQFMHENRPDTDWTRVYPILKKREAILVKFEKQGMDASLWDGSRKLAGNASLYKDYPPYMGCEDDKDCSPLNKKFPADWKNKVHSVLTGSRAKSMEVGLAKGTMDVLWKDYGDVTSIVPFDVDPLDAQMRVTELEKALSLSSVTSPRHLPVVKAMAGKWVRRTQQKKSFPVGNNLYSAEDRMYIIFKGDDLRENTRLSAGDAATFRAHQKLTPTYISEIPFDPCEWPSAMPGVDREVYKEMERNLTQLAHLLEFVCKKGKGIMFLDKPHKRVVWEVLKSGRYVAALEGNSEFLQYTLEFLKREVDSGANRCEFISRTEIPTLVREPSTNMWFKLSERKRSRIYEFLFLETRPRRDNDAEYMRRKEHMLALLDNYHDASCKNAKNFLDRLECLYFVESEHVLKLESYGALISTNDEVKTGVVFDTAMPEEDNDTEDIDIDYHPALVFHAPGSSSVGPSTSQATQVSLVLTLTPGKTPSKLAARLTLRPAAPPPLHPGSSVPLRHPSCKDDTINFEGLNHTRSSEADWGHDMIWHPGTIQSAIQKGEWIMALINDQGLWEPYPRQSKAEYLELARSSVVERVRSASPNLQPADPAIDSTVELLFEELQDKQCLELLDEFYNLDTSPSKGWVDRKVLPTTGPQEGRDGGEEGEEGKEEEGKENELFLFRGGEEGEQGDFNIEDEERVDSEDDAGCEESSDSLGLQYTEHRRRDVDNDATAMEMETQVVSDLSADPEDYEVQPLTAAIDLQHLCDEVSIVVSPKEQSQHISIVEVIDGILSDERVSAERCAAPIVDGPRIVTPSVPSATIFSPPSSPVLPATFVSGSKGEVGGR
ncbi:hypothetical protein CBR_g25999 [Chara braunii]|uniref:Uncharacterized protein n=1 Tax=Chara braunii TaxID=69332 RepID=A0A388L748_CHABU|nr:hypothetical protein CBR_g25999 [Chara braunii]|eukprot:GBG78062.1 hypothetical protein CBR_g25999 [Chara braunii]